MEEKWHDLRTFPDPLLFTMWNVEGSIQALKILNFYFMSFIKGRF